MRFDICCCTYRSEKWLDGFFAAIEKLEYDKKQIGIYFADNDSPDGTVAALEKHRRRLAGQFADFEVAQMGCNAGFGRSSNRAAGMGGGEYVLFLNVDTAILPDALTELEAAIRAAAPGYAAFELRQYPYEHPKYYDPVTLETSWASGAAVAVRRTVLEQLGGFDETIFMYCEDVELSWRLRAAGYRIRYVPRAGLMHYTSGKASALENAGQLAGEKLLRLKYAPRRQLVQWNEEERYRELCPEGSDARTLSDRLLRDVDLHRREYRRFYRRTARRSGLVPDFRDGFADLRQGGRYACVPVRQDGRISVIVRADAHPALLRRTLESLSHQTCRDFRVVLVDDGEAPVCGAVAAEYADRLQLDYLPLRRQAGHCAAGNAGLAAVKTPYAVFLDAGDCFFADHIETSAAAITAHPDGMMFCSHALAANARLIGADCEITQLSEMPLRPMSRACLWQDGPVPIQTVVFDMALYRQYGGFDEEPDALADRELWMRYAQTAKICTVPKTISVFLVPADAEERRRRDRRIDASRPVLYEKAAACHAELSAQDVYGLSWYPEKKLPPVDDVAQLKASARALLASPVRRAAAPLRAALYALSDFFGRQAAFFGPEDVAPETASVKELQQFVRKSRSCGYLRLVTKLTRKGKS